VNERCDFTVEKDGETIWYNSRDVYWAFTFLTLAPSESKEFTWSWDMENVDGDPVGFGDYDITGVLSDLSGRYPDEPAPVSVTITITPRTILVPDDYPTIQQAIDAAFDGDTVLVIDGTYSGEGNRDIDFLGKAITVRSESGPENCIIDCETLGSAFYFHRGEDAHSLLDGFTITNGHGGIGGGGIFCSSASPRVANCVITSNAGQVAGGGLCFRGGKPTITDCTIKGNFADRGAGIYCDNNSSPTITNCTITANSADRDGGGIYCKDSSPTLINCTLTGNSATYDGGAIMNIRASATVKNCIFNANSAESGGAVYNDDTTITVETCSFTGNSAQYSGGALENNHSTQNVTGCLFTGNSASSGGAISGAAGPIINCTFTGNSAYSGGAISGWPIEIPIENCILWGDTPDEIGSGWWPWDSPFSYVKFSNVQGGYPGQGNIDADPCFVDPGYWADANDANIIVEPSDPNAVWVDGDYHLLVGSPCIDTGDPNYVPEPNETDLDGKARIVNNRIDMGAYEYSPPIPAEIDITPKTLNLSSKGRWIVCRIRLPEDYNVTDIDPNSVLLEDEIETSSLQVNGQVAIVKFSRSDVQDIFDVGQTELTITGQLTDGTEFEGADSIRLIDRHHPK